MGEQTFRMSSLHTPRPAMPECWRQHVYGPIQPANPAGWLDRLWKVLGL